MPSTAHKEATASARRVAWLDLGAEEYERAYEIQLRLHALRQAKEIPDTAVLVEHPACITIGRGSRQDHILVSREELLAAGIGVHNTDRGGDVTYHGPGQLVLYPIVDLDCYGRDVHAHARRLEQVLIEVAALFGVQATRRKEYPGVWTVDGKIGAIGLSVKRWVTLHGVSLNVCPDMSHFSLIVPCGLEYERVTSLAEVLGRKVETDAAKRALRDSFERVFAVGVTDVTMEDLEPLQDNRMKREEGWST